MRGPHTEESVQQLKKQKLPKGSKVAGTGNFRFENKLRRPPALLPATFEFLALLQYYPKDCRAVQNLHTTNARYKTKNKPAKSADCKRRPDYDTFVFP